MKETNAHAANAKKVMAALKAIEKMIPYLRTRNPRDANFVRGLVNVPIPFMQVAAHTATKSPALQVGRKITPDRAHDVLQYLNAYVAVRNQLIYLLDTMSFSMQALKAELASDSLRVYALAKALARDIDAGEAILGDVENMRKLLGRRGPKSAKAKTERPTPPSPPAKPARKRAKRARKR